jgi:hypothetical protein
VSIDLMIQHCNPLEDHMATSLADMERHLKHAGCRAHASAVSLNDFICPAKVDALLA